MFRQIDPAGSEATLEMTFEGETIPARPGDTVAAALLAAGITHLRETPRTSAPRGAFCLMGACYDCMVVIDGQPNRQACMTIAEDAMTITRQGGDGG